jgi:hypothetical protein
VPAGEGDPEPSDAVVVGGVVGGVVVTGGDVGGVVVTGGVVGGVVTGVVGGVVTGTVGGVLAGSVVGDALRAHGEVWAIARALAGPTAPAFTGCSATVPAPIVWDGPGPGAGGM